MSEGFTIKVQSCLECPYLSRGERLSCTKAPCDEHHNWQVIMDIGGIPSWCPMASRSPLERAQLLLRNALRGKGSFPLGYYTWLVDELHELLEVKEV